MYDIAETSFGRLPVDLSVQLNPFHAALAAFEIRFDRELTSRWQNLEYKAGEATDGAPSEKRRSVLYRFFEDAEREIGNVVHEYFPKLLQVATTQRQHLGNDAPLPWTQAQVLRQVCTFLGVDEKFDFTLAPKDESRLVVATARIALGTGWLDDDIPADFVFPGWLSSDWLLRQDLRRLFPSALDDAESLPPLSRAETLEWIKRREFWMRRVLERQIDNDSWDGIILTEKTHDQGDRSWKKSDFGRDETVDDRARSELSKRMLKIEDDIAYRSEIDDKQMVKELQDEYATIKSYLGGSRTVRGRPRVFSDENEKARTSISHALRRAYEGIREQAPQTEAHLKSSISTGSKFAYRDASRYWNVRRA